MSGALTGLLDKIKLENGGLLEALRLVQEHEGYLSEQSIKQISEHFHLPQAQVYETGTFYSYLHLEPVGQHVIRVCESAPCHVAGAAKIVAELERLLDVKMGDTTKNGRFTLKFTQCVGQCQGSPTITIDGEPYTELTPEKLPPILAAYQ